MIEILIKFRKENNSQHLIEYLCFDLFFYYKTHVIINDSNKNKVIVLKVKKEEKS